MQKSSNWLEKQIHQVHSSPDTSLKFLFQFFYCRKKNWASEFSGLSTIYRSKVTQIVLLVWSATSATLWVDLSFSSKSLDIGGICRWEGFSSQLKFSAATRNWFCVLRNWLESGSPFARFCTSQKFSWISWVLYRSSLSYFSTRKKRLNLFLHFPKSL